MKSFASNTSRKTLIKCTTLKGIVNRSIVAKVTHWFIALYWPTKLLLLRRHQRMTKKIQLAMKKILTRDIPLNLTKINVQEAIVSRTRKRRRPEKHKSRQKKENSERIKCQNMSRRPL